MKQARKANKLSLQNRLKIGPMICCSTYDSYVDLYALVNKSCGKSKNISRLCKSVLKSIDALRNELDNEFAKIVSQEEWDQQKLAKTYYGN